MMVYIFRLELGVYGFMNIFTKQVQLKKLSACFFSMVIRWGRQS